MYYARKHDNPGTTILAFLAGAATAAAAGTYFLYGPDGKTHRKQLERGADKLKRELVARMNDVSELTQDSYESIVDDLLKRYNLAKRLGKEKTAHLSTALKARWEEMKDAAERAREDAEYEIDDEELDKILF